MGSFFLASLTMSGHEQSLVAAATAAVAAAAAAFTTTATATTTVAAATTAVSTTTSAAAITAATTAGWASFHGTGFVHHQSAAAMLLTVEARNSCLCFGVAAHFYESKAFGATGVALHHDFGAGDVAKSSKCTLQVFVTERIRQVADVKFIAQDRDSSKNT